MPSLKPFDRTAQILADIGSFLRRAKIVNDHQ